MSPDGGGRNFSPGSKWLHISVEADKVEKEVPDGGIVLDYDFTIGEAGRYEVWNRVGFEFVRSPFEWRIDDGAWEAVSPEELTTDLMELAFWCEVAWLKMGEADLTGREAPPAGADPEAEEQRRANGGG